MWYLGPAKAQTSLCIRSLCKSLEYSMNIKLPAEHHLEFVSLKGGCTGSLESTVVKMPHCWKSHVVAQYKQSFDQICYHRTLVKSV